MPAKSKAQRRLMGLAAHHPEQLYPQNRDVLKMSAADLMHFASTSEKKLPKRAKKGKR